jgi:hypothetical protein
LRKVGAGLDPDFLREAVRVMSALLMDVNPNIILAKIA